jgi:sugar phosphate isomerase/epimerase
MRLAASQIAWEPGAETAALALLAGYGYVGLEIAPTRVAGQCPYDRPAAAADYARAVRERHGLAVCSMQSIWFGQSGSLFGPERQALLAYTLKAIGFAKAAGCGNLVFGCPKNRVLPEDASPDEAVPFFAELGAAAAAAGAVVALEANPPMYGTNFINTTPQALAMARRVASPGFKVNLDVGTLIANGEGTAELAGQVYALSHVHVSEPGLAAPEKRPLHRELAALLRHEGYAGYVSIEMKAAKPGELERALEYVAGVFG